MKPIGLYLHFPFCEQKCRYCDFPSWAGKKDRMEAYLEALLLELESYRGCIPETTTVSSIFMGGGTPTLFHEDLLVRVLEKSRECFPVQEDAEITIECNPGSVDEKKLRALAKGGINRLSIGLQAWQDHHLEFLGRIHRHEQFENTVKWALGAGFINISADVIFGIPGQTEEEWIETLEKTIACGIQHLSAYSLKLEEGTVLYHWQQQGKLREMEDDRERRLYHMGIHRLKELGFGQYEISNFALPGYESRHNLNYWKNGEYIGCGSGAHSYYQSQRRGNVPGIEQYIGKMRNENAAVAFREEIDFETEVFESLMLAFRLNKGVNKKEFQSRFHFSLSDRYGKVIEGLKKQGFLEEEEHWIRPTTLGFDFENRIAMAFLDEQ